MRAKSLCGIFLGAALAVALVVQSPDASACECDLWPDILPADGAAVPSTARIWINDGFGCEQPYVLDTSGTRVPGRLDAIANDCRVLTPTTELQVGETYAVHCERFGDSYPESTFSVSEGPDIDPPQIPEATVGETDSSSGGDSCGEWSHVHMNVTHDGDLLLLDIAGLADLDAETLTGSVVDVFSTFQYEGSVFIGTGPCDGNWNFDENGDATDVRWATFDLSGNFSGWSPPQDVSDGCGCALIGSRRGNAPGAWLGLGLAALALLRTRRRRA